jgi:hypothetical protein
MTDTDIQEQVARLKHLYGTVDRLAENSSGPQLLRINEARVPKGCSPSRTRVLLRIAPGQPRPEIFVQPGIRLPNGKEPRSTSTVLVAGESWLQFSFSFPWDEQQHTLDQFVAASLQRFARSE